jgi:uncharacterized protein YebE (UPF0316 family)
MLTTIFANFDYYSWIILPIIIFLSRLTDVSLGTLRHVFISKGYRKIVPVLGFFEVLIWIIVVAQVMQNLSNWVCYIAYAGGFAAGTYVGLRIEEKLALGLQVVRIITKQNCDILISELRSENYGVTIVDAEGGSGPVKMIFTIVKRKSVRVVIEKIKNNNPNAFYSVEEIKDTNQGIFTQASTSNFRVITKMFPTGKSK